jgi:hypothetical protein
MAAVFPPEQPKSVTTIAIPAYQAYVQRAAGATAYHSGATFSLTSARATGPGSMEVDWGGDSGAYVTFAPGSAVPEPATTGLFGVGLVAVLLRRRLREHGPIRGAGRRLLR